MSCLCDMTASGVWALILLLVIAFGAVAFWLYRKIQNLQNQAIKNKECIIKIADAMDTNFDLTEARLIELRNESLRDDADVLSKVADVVGKIEDTINKK